MRQFAPQLRGHRVILFGSRASGTARLRSDFDVGVIGDEPLPVKVFYEIDDMRAQIVTTGERLYCADARECDTFEDFVFSSYARLNEERREILRDIKQRESVYG